MEAFRAPANFARRSCELLSPREASSCVRNGRVSGTHYCAYSRKQKNLQREACEAVLEGFRSSHSLVKLDIRRPLLWDNHAGCGGPAQEIGTAIARVSEEEQGILGVKGLSSHGGKSCSIASSRFRVGRSSINVRKSKLFDGFFKGRKQTCVPPICGVENGVASEVLVETFGSNIPSDTSGAVILPSASYIESSALHRTEHGSRSTNGTHTLAPSKDSVPGLGKHTEVSPFRPAQLVECFEVEGGIRLSGEVQISGAKNSALAILAGAICSEGQVHLQMIPDLHDIRRMLQVLQSVGVSVQRTSSGFMVDARDLTSVEPCAEAVRKLRASFFVIGSLLGRRGEAVVPLPGGCNIGARPIDLHVRGLEALGAKVEIRQGKVYARAQNGRNLIGGNFCLDYPSVGATETLMMAAALADGHSTLSNVAQEPEVVDLANFLISCGAFIKGAGTNTLSITGTRKLHGTEYKIIPDRIEAGTFLIAAAITRSAISMSPVIPKHLTSVVEKLRSIGCRVQQTRWNSLQISCNEVLRSCEVKTLPYPGFPTDLQPQLMSLLTTCSGQSLIEETVFEGRMRHAEELQKLGAQVKVSRNIAIINGKDTGSSLYGAPVLATDLRAGAALVLAGMSSDGTTHIEGVGHIDRGYERLDQKLRLLGASIRRLPCLPTELTL
ncbi:hypothetical protein KC19_8G093500 [Ceratodon purpureus]|uniref:UDP-N-acetylglucosamine 1-carboxyvinyltransferase n=1 Tax=Ceratodon purpureus TaxID=3225 RepID=A0A8T0H1I8_CERPU|nr:hypothetical protein KC19_8G093500 [Ceratodon purpureus]